MGRCPAIPEVASAIDRVASGELISQCAAVGLQASVQGLACLGGHQALFLGVKARLLEVLRVQKISPHFVRVTLGGADLAGFVSASFDDHLKLMLPAEGQSEPVLPNFSGEGPKWPEGVARPVMRDYTPRRHDPVLSELDLDFALHGEGQAANWAAQVKPGDRAAGVGRGSQTGRIAGRCEGHRGDAVGQFGRSGALSDAVRALTLPSGEGYAWASGEAGEIADVRRVLVGEHGLDKAHVRAAAYWKQGNAGHHENLGD